MGVNLGLKARSRNLARSGLGEISQVINTSILKPKIKRRPVMHHWPSFYFGEG